ncbi:MAG: hypothetical protein ACKVQW_07350 [Pyrinomonadaceae bacterium]
MEELKKRLIILIFCSSLFFLSCGSKCDPPIPLQSEEILDTRNEGFPLSTDIYLDATLSMQGFTNASGYLSNYQLSIPVLERIAGGEVSFWKFGNEPVSIKREDYLKADKPVFYPNTQDLKETRIQNVISQANESHLTLVVTDLFQESADINVLISLIKEKYVKKNIAVGILAVKSQFNGTVYNVGTNDRTFNWASGDDPSKFRPFYILAFGKYGDINNYFEKFDSETRSFETYDNKDTGFSIKKRIIFSRYLVEKPSMLLDAKITPNNSVAKMAPGILVKTSSPKNPFKELVVGEKAEGEAFTAEIPLTLLNNTIDFSTELKAEIQSSTCGGKTNNQITEPPIIVEAITPDKQKIRLSVKVTGRKLIAQTTNVFRIILRPKSFTSPAWVGEWNMTGEQVEQWFKDKKEFQGSKTHNLSQFMSALWIATEEEFHPKIADFYCFFKRG